MPTHPTAGAIGPIEVMVVDDSALVRQTIKAIIESDARFRVVLAADPYEAAALLSKSVPGLILLDVEMPRMDGLTFLRKLMRQHPMPVVLCTDQAERAVTALEMGAIEVIAKPDWRDPAKMALWGHNLLGSVQNAARAGRLPMREDKPSATDPRHTADVVLPKMPYVPRGGVTERVVAVGVSTGGVQAVPKMLEGFPADAPGVVIVQHMPADFIPVFVSRLDANPSVKLRVAVAKHLDPIVQGQVLVIPGDSHGLIRRTGAGYRVELVDGPPVCWHRPSAEVLFRSTAQAAGPLAAGVIMTGMRDDGAGGLLEMREAGAMTVAQNEATCAVFGMPQAAIRRGAVKFVTPLDRIAAMVMGWYTCEGSGRSA